MYAKNGYNFILLEIVLGTLTSVQIKHSSNIHKGFVILNPYPKGDTSCDPLHGFEAHMVHYIEIRIQKGMNSFWTNSNSSLSDSRSKIVIRFSPFQSLCFILLRYNHLNHDIFCLTHVFAREFKCSFSNSPT